MVQTGLFALKKRKKRKRRVRLYWVELRVCGHLGLFILLALSLSSPGVVAVFFSLRGRLRGITLSGCFLFCILAVC